MSIIHIANCAFEEELQGKTGGAYPVIQQLEFLPFLYADPEENVWTSTSVPSGYLTHLEKMGITHPRPAILPQPGAELVAWGATPKMATFAKQHHLKYEMPRWEVVQEVNSKQFSFINSPPLPGAALLHHRKEAEAWMANITGAVVFKTCFGATGRGHFFNTPDLFEKLEQEWREGRPVIGEPWVGRLYDFSTQWEITQSGKIDYLGATLCENTLKGVYAATRAGFLSLPHLDEHKEVVLPVLEKMSHLGYFGNVGIDAFVYGDETLHPIVEINARKTMGWVALQMQQRHFPNHTVEIRYANTISPGLLPQIGKRQLILNLVAVKR